MKRILLTAAMAAMGSLAAHAPSVMAQAAPRDFSYPVQPGLNAVLRISSGESPQVTVRVGNGPEQTLGAFDEAVDYPDSVDIDHDGYRDLVLGQSGGSSQVIARLFLYRPATRTFQEIAHPGQASPCHGFVNPAFDKTQPVIRVACRYGAASNGFEEYVLRPDGTARATSWTTQALFDLESTVADITTHFAEDGSTQRIDIDGEGSALDGGTVPVSKLDLYDTPDVNARPTLTAADGDPLEVIALRPHGNLQVRVTTKTAGTVVKWVRYADLRVDKHALVPEQSERQLELELADTLADWNGDDGGYFIVSVANRGEAPVAVTSPRVWLLLTTPQGDRIVHPLFQREGDTLYPANPLGFAREPVVWSKDEAGTPAYVIDDMASGNVAFLPNLAPGKYRLAAVMTDPGNLTGAIVSNEIEFDYPLPKRPPAVQ